ncbi:hypothetical protein Smp_004590 [Schistosoma mansoni]|uniref:hypothetical protein n=1 Tax=Schistosoma mansoni TaxID=6183 RepID=UPI0001A62F89|nr:hypothetical protein Smp_004590 [Schistosoma mansoni]|eukprot:XP_018652408.1 hypothetical protein Smp_004590 [Schistosoma mansoni]
MSEGYILAALEFLIQYGGTQSIKDLWVLMCNKFHQVSDFKHGVGKSHHSFEKFLLSNPTIFNVVDNFVCLTDISNPLENEKDCPHQYNSRCNNNSFKNPRNIRSKYTIESEASAVRYFQEQLLRKPERWVPIRNLAGHLSQASPHIRLSVGPQSEFLDFLTRHSLIFEIQGDLVGLKNRTKTVPCTPQQPINKKKGVRPLSSHFPDDLHRISVPCSRIDNNYLSLHRTGPEESAPKLQSEDNIIVCLDDCKALFWLMYVIKHNLKDEIMISRLLAELSHAPDSVRNCIGWTQIELSEFLKKYNRIFTVDEVASVVEVHYTNKLNLFVASRHINDSSCGLIVSQKGCIFCVNRLWGIIDLGFHEHVFFDRSLFKNVTDLTKHFKIKEVVYFNAILAPKDSRAKWRATCVWKETDQIINQLTKVNHSDNNNTNNNNSNLHPHTPSHERHEQLNDDPDSGLDNSDEIIDPKKNKLNDDANSKRDQSIKSLFDEDNMSAEYEFIIKQFANVRMADVWEIEQFTNQLKHTNSDVLNSNTNTTVVNHSNNNNQYNHAKDHHRLSLLSQYNPVDHERSLSVSNESLSDLNTLSEIPSIMSGIQLEPPSTIPSLNYAEHETDHGGNPKQLYKLLTHKPGCPCQCLLSSTLIQEKKSMNSVTTQTLFTGEVKGKFFYHETQDGHNHHS